MQGIYVHIPFCETKCGYCDFHSIVADGSFVGNYIEAFQKEIEYYGKKSKDRIFDTLFIGGGTPTILTTFQLQRIISTIFDNFNFSNKFEFSVEANPGTLDECKVEKLVSLGVNRVSLGAQAFQNDMLKKIGRQHTVADIIASAKRLMQAGIINFNLDLMYGLPEQTIKQWDESLNQAIALKPPHLSCYSLIVEEGTPFYDLLQADQLNLPGEEREYAMFQLTRETLRRAGYEHYEISNFALSKSYQSKHNLLYWRNQSYLGLGSGAHGYIDKIRYVNSHNLEQYIKSWSDNTPAIASQELVSNDQAMDETMMLGLRLLDGVEEAQFERLFNRTLTDVYGNEIKKLLERGLLTRENGWLKLTDTGVSLGNLVFSAFIR